MKRIIEKVLHFSFNWARASLLLLFNFVQFRVMPRFSFLSLSPSLSFWHSSNCFFLYFNLNKQRTTRTRHEQHFVKNCRQGVKTTFFSFLSHRCGLKLLCSSTALKNNKKIWFIPITAKQAIKRVSTSRKHYIYALCTFISWISLSENRLFTLLWNFQWFFEKKTGRKGRMTGPKKFSYHLHRL